VRDVVADAATRAPSEPGVYYFLGAARELLYVGKAGNLRRRLGDHARSDGTGHGFRLRGLYDQVATIRWETTASERAACAREIDVIVTLQPPYNGSHRDNGRWVFVVLEQLDATDGTMRIRLATEQPAASGRRDVFGCFPHLGVGVGSTIGIACSEGYASLVRLLWAASDPSQVHRFPRKISGPSPPASIEVRVATELRRPLGDLLSGTSRRVIDTLRDVVEAPHVEAYLRPALRRDLSGAEAFFRDGPRAIRALRLRHGLRAGALSRETIGSLIARDVAAVIA